MKSTNRSKKFVLTALLVALFAIVASKGAIASEGECKPGTSDGPVSIERLHFASGEGEGYRLIYCIDVPLVFYWPFKTDFQNAFLTENPHIDAHRFIRRNGNVVLTENRYAHDNKRLFRWQTTVHGRDHRLDFKLVNPEQAGQKFHYGTIRLEARGRQTIVHQTARFRFSGAALWAFYPWRGGMRSFLTSFVRWEQQAALDWRPHYEAQVRERDRKPSRMDQVFSVNARYPAK